MKFHIRTGQSNFRSDKNVGWKSESAL